MKQDGRDLGGVRFVDPFPAGNEKLVAATLPATDGGERRR